MPAETIDEMLERIDKLVAITPLRSYGESETGNTQRGRWLAICDALCEVYPALAAAYRAQGEEVERLKNDLRTVIEVCYGLADQQAMQDDSWHNTVKPLEAKYGKVHELKRLEGENA